MERVVCCMVWCSVLAEEMTGLNWGFTPTNLRRVRVKFGSKWTGCSVMSFRSPPCGRVIIRPYNKRQDAS